MKIKNQIINILCRYLENVTEDEIQNNENNLLRLGINSIVFIKLVVEIEKEFDIEFDDEMLDYTQFNSLGMLCAYVEKCLDKL